MIISEGQLRQQLLWINVLNSITRSIAQRNSIDSILRVVLKHLEDNFPNSFGGITLCKEDKKKDARSKVQDFETGNRIEIKKDDEKKDKEGSKNSRKELKKEKKEKESILSGGSIIDIKV